MWTEEGQCWGEDPGVEGQVGPRAGGAARPSAAGEAVM